MKPIILFFSGNRIYITLLFFLLLSFVAVKADVGETYDLKNKRDGLLQEIINDSLNKKQSEKEMVQTISTYKAAIEIDNQIFSSYQSTVYRTSSDEYQQKLGNRVIVNIAFILAFAFILAILIIYRQNKLLKVYTHNDYTLASMLKEMVVFSSPLFQKNAMAYKVNKLLYISILVMAIFIFIGLLSQI